MAARRFPLPYVDVTNDVYNPNPVPLKGPHEMTNWPGSVARAPGPGKKGLPADLKHYE